MLVIDVGTSDAPGISGDVTRAEVEKQGGGEAAFTRSGGPAAALTVMAAGAKAVATRLQAEGRIRAVIGIAGGKGSALFKEAVADLPFGFPKVLVSSARPQLLASFAETTDIALFPTLVDLFGVNDFTERVLRNAGAAVAAMEWRKPPDHRRKVVGVTAFGVTTAAVSQCVALLKAAGVEPIAFPANGAGGRLMERLVLAGEIDAVLDLTITELADEIAGGSASAGPDRLTAAGMTGVPHLVAPGAVDMINFGPRTQVPQKFEGRLFYQHTPHTTLVRTDVDENRRIGMMAGRQLAMGRGKLTVLFPSGGFSDYDRPGQPFFDPAADQAFLDGLRATLPKRADLRVVDCHINDPHFARAAVDWILATLSISEKAVDGQEVL